MNRDEAISALQRAHARYYGLDKLKTLAVAHKAVMHLWDENKNLRLEIAALKRKRGRARPKKLPEFRTGGGFLGTLSLEVANTEKKKGGGRPGKTTEKEKVEAILNCEELKKLVAGNSRKQISDKEIITRIADVRSDTKSLRSDEKKKLIKRMCRQLKDWRDETGIRRWKQKKRKTPLKNT